MREALSQVAENMQLFGKAMEEHVQLIRSIDGAVNTFRAEAQNFAASVKKVIEVIEDFKDKVLEAYNAITSILAKQQSFQQPAPQNVKEDFRIILPEPVRSEGIQTKLIVEPKRRGSSQIHDKASRQLPAQTGNVCPFLREGGCTANLSGYASYVSKRIREEYCLSGRHQECWQYQYYVKHYGGLRVGSR